MCFNISIVSSIATIEQQFNAEFHADFDFMPQEHISAFGLVDNSADHHNYFRQSLDL